MGIVLHLCHSLSHKPNYHLALQEMIRRGNGPWRTHESPVDGGPGILINPLSFSQSWGHTAPSVASSLPPQWPCLSLCCKAAVYLEQRNRLISNSFDANKLNFAHAASIPPALSVFLLLLSLSFYFLVGLLSVLGLTARKLPSTVPSALGGYPWGLILYGHFLSLSLNIPTYPIPSSHAGKAKEISIKGFGLWCFLLLI